MSMNLESKLQNQWEKLNGNKTIDPEVVESLPDNTVDVVPDFAITLAEAKERIFLLQKFVAEMMVPGVDFGYIPDVNKPSLFKPGAEKLCDIFGFSKQIAVIDRVVDWEKGMFAYEVKATLINKRTGYIEAEGIGSCNSLEKKYKQQDGYTISNTVLKMAKKRALVDAVLSATRSSAIFTQDIEDMEIRPEKPNTQPVFLEAKPGTSKPEGQTKPKQSKPASEKQLGKIYYLAKEIGLPSEAARELMLDRYGVENSKQLNSKQASDFIQYLESISRS